jgi:hypothetical protein
MPASHDVFLAADRQVVWPALCPGCGAANPRNLLPVSGSRSSIAAFFWPILHLFQRRARFEVPVCDGCRGAELRSRWLRFLLLVAFALAGIACADPWAKELTDHRLLRRLIVLGVVLVGIVPLIAWQVLAPAAVDVTIGKATVTFEFRRADYATSFAQHNGS